MYSIGRTPEDDDEDDEAYTAKRLSFNHGDGKMYLIEALNKQIHSSLCGICKLICTRDAMMIA